MCKNRGNWRIESRFYRLKCKKRQNWQIEKDKPASKKATSLDDFKKALENNGFTIKEEISKEASLIQSESGKGFILEDDTAVEVYEYYEFEEAKKEK